MSLISVTSLDEIRIEVFGEGRAKTIPASRIVELFDQYECGLQREMEFFVADLHGTRHWKTVRGSASACWGALCGIEEADPKECQSRGWKVLRCVANAIESDLRFHG